MNPAQAIPDFEAIWAEIQLLLEWQHGFGFYLVLSDDPRSARQLRQPPHEGAADTQYVQMHRFSVCRHTGAICIR